MGPHPPLGVLIRRERRDTRTHGELSGAQRSWRRRLERCSGRRGMPNLAPARRSQDRGPDTTPSEPSKKGTTLPAAWSCPSSPRIRERKYFCCSMPLSLWSFVIVAPETNADGEECRRGWDKWKGEGARQKTPFEPTLICDKTGKDFVLYISYGYTNT